MLKLIFNNNGIVLINTQHVLSITKVGDIFHVVVSKEFGRLHRELTKTFVGAAGDVGYTMHVKGFEDISRLYTSDLEQVDGNWL